MIGNVEEFVAGRTPMEHGELGDHIALGRWYGEKWGAPTGAFMDPGITSVVAPGLEAALWRGFRCALPILTRGNLGARDVK